MSRMHSSKRGRASSRRPAVRENPSWVQMQPAEVKEAALKLAREGKSQALIGLILRDQYGVPDIKLLTGKKLSEIIKEGGMAPQIPDDLNSLILKARNVSRHLRDNKKDYSNNRGLQLIESKIRRLTKYYKREGIIPANWTYSFEMTKLER